MDRRSFHESIRASFFRRGSRESYKPVCIAYETGRQCTADRCPLRHEMPKNPHRSASFQPPEDQSIKTLHITRINQSVLEHQDIRHHFCTYGEIESIRVSASRTYWILTYTTRQSAEKAMADLPGWVNINGQRLRLQWGPQEIRAFLPQQQRMDPQRKDSVISTQEVGDSISSDNHGDSSSSYQSPPPERLVVQSPIQQSADLLTKLEII